MKVHLIGMPSFDWATIKTRIGLKDLNDAKHLLDVLNPLSLLPILEPQHDRPEYLYRKSQDISLQHINLNFLVQEEDLSFWAYFLCVDLRGITLSLVSEEIYIITAGLDIWRKLIVDRTLQEKPFSFRYFTNAVYLLLYDQGWHELFTDYQRIDLDDGSFTFNLK